MCVGGATSSCWSVILPYLVLGGETAAADRELLLKLGVRWVINVSKEVPNFFDGEFEYTRVSVEDDGKFI